MTDTALAASAATPPIQRLRATLSALDEASARLQEARSRREALETQPLEDESPDAVQRRIEALAAVAADITDATEAVDRFRREAQALDIAAFQQRAAARTRDYGIALRERDEVAAEHEKLVARREGLQQAIVDLSLQIEEAASRLTGATSQLMSLEPLARRKVHLSPGIADRDTPRGMVRLLEWHRAWDAMEDGNFASIEITVDERTGRIVATNCPGLAVDGGDR